MHERILMIEDEPGAAMTVGDRLKSEGFKVDVAVDGLQGGEMAQAGIYDVILLDVMLPGKDGISLCRDLRAHGLTTPIIMVSAKGEISDKVIGLKIGADDYITKPFSPLELMARIEAVLRRQQVTSAGGDRRTFQFGPFRLDTDRGELLRDQSPVSLSSLEYQLLVHLLKNRNRVLSRDQLLDAVWGYESTPESRTVDVHIARLRQKLDDTGPIPRYIKTIMKRGYRFIG